MTTAEEESFGEYSIFPGESPAAVANRRRRVEAILKAAEDDRQRQAQAKPRVIGIGYLFIRGKGTITPAGVYEARRREAAGQVPGPDEKPRGKMAVGVGSEGVFELSESEVAEYHRAVAAREFVREGDWQATPSPAMDRGGDER